MKSILKNFHYPLPFQKLLDQCPEKVARIGQIENWLRENIDYYDWCSNIWSLMDHEEGSEEYAFCQIYDSLTEVFQLYSYESRVKSAINTFPTDDDFYVLWKWIKTHQSFYDDYFCLFHADYQIYDRCNESERKHLTILIPCFKGIHLYIHKDDFDFVFDFIELYQPYSYLDEPFDIDEKGDPKIFNYDDIDEDTGLDFLNEDEEDDGNLNIKNEYILTEAAVNKLLVHENTMVDIQEIVAWVEDYRKLKDKMEHDHLPFCGCSACDVFVPLFYEMDHLARLFIFKNKYIVMAAEYAEMKKDHGTMTDFFCQHYRLINKIEIPLNLYSKKNGLYVFDNKHMSTTKIHFVFIDKTMQIAYDNHTFFNETALAFHEYLIDRFNEENKTYYMKYNFRDLVNYFHSRLPEVSEEFFNQGCEWSEYPISYDSY